MSDKRSDKLSDSINLTNTSDYILDYYPCSQMLAKKFNDARKSPDKFSLTARCAFDYIALNAQSISEGRSRRIDVDELAQHLEISRVRAYQVLAELEAHGFIIPKSKQSRWQYDIPAFPEHRDDMKDTMQSKEQKKIQRMIDILAVIMKKQTGFSGRISTALTKILSEITHYTDDELHKAIWQATGINMSELAFHRFKDEIGKLEK